MKKKPQPFTAWICEDALGTYDPYLSLTRKGAQSAKNGVKELRDAKWRVRKVRVTYQ